jgi:hypothetical protein
MYWEQSTEKLQVETPCRLTGLVEPLDIDEIEHRLSQKMSPARRRLVGRAGLPLRGKADDHGRGTAPRIELVLYTSPSSEKSRRAVRAIREILKRYDASQVKLTTCDLSVNPQDGDVDSVLFTPTLVKQGPGPRTSIIGNLEQPDALRDLLDASGVDRRWDD